MVQMRLELQLCRGFDVEHNCILQEYWKVMDCTKMEVWKFEQRWGWGVVSPFGNEKLD